MPTRPPEPPFALPEAWTKRTLPALRKALLAWFAVHRRPMPWRDSRAAYPIWVSEVMLQQTTVAAVVPYFERFLAAFPTVRHLADADEQQVLHLWQGLGYYRRARHLHAAAKRLVADHGDALPDDPAVWAELPGVGRYILGAVLSQAFERKLPIVEANSLRVLARWFASPLDPRAGPGQKWVWAAAAAVLPDARVGDFNQAVMELGATVCTPVAPRCETCPVAKWCEAKRLGRQATIPPKAKAKAIATVAEVGVILHDEVAVRLFQRRPDAARWAGMWEVPHGEVGPGEPLEAAAARVVRELTGFTPTLGEEVATVRHGVTRFAITLTGFEATIRGGAFAAGHYAQVRTVPAAALADYPMSTSQRKLLTEWRRPDRGRRLF